MEELEQIMRRIHILFSKCEVYGNESEGKIIVPKKEFFRLLEKLSYAVIRMMDEYEATQESRERGIKNFYQEGEKIKAAAQSGADDVYAASLIYTDNMLEELSDVLADAKEELWEQYARMAERLDRQAKVLREDQEEIQQQLGAMAQSEKYLKLIERENERLKQQQERELLAEVWEDEEDEDEEEYEEEDDYEEEEEYFGEPDTEEPESDLEGTGADADEEIPLKNSGNVEGDSDGADLSDGDKTDETVEKESQQGSGAAVGDTLSKEKETETAGGKAEKKDIKPAETPIGRAASNKPQRPVQNQKKNGSRRKVSAGRHARMSPDLEAEWAEEEAKRKVRKIGTAIYEDVGEEYDPPVKHVSYEIKVNPGYLAMRGEDSANLDAEYFRWQEEEGQAAATDGQTKEEEPDDMPQIQVLGKPDEKKEDKKEKKKRGLKFGKHG